MSDSILVKKIEPLGCILAGIFMDAIMWGVSSESICTGMYNFLIGVSEAGDIDTLLYASPSHPDGIVISLRVMNEKIYVMTGDLYYEVGTREIEIYSASAFEHIETIINENVFTLNDFDVDNAGNVYMAGCCLLNNTVFNGTVLNAEDGFNVYLVKYNSSHEFEWIKAYDDSIFSFPKVRVSPDGEAVYMSAQFYYPLSFGSINLEGPNWVYDFFVAKFNPAGIVQWAKEIPNYAMGDATISERDCIIAKDDGVALTGYFRKYLTWDTDTLLAQPDVFASLFVLKLNADGDAEWVKGIQEQEGNFSTGRSLGSAGDSYYLNGIFGGLITFSDEYSFTGEGFKQGFTAKLSPGVTGISFPVGKIGFSIFPNPATDFLYLRNNPDLKGSAFEIYSVDGRQLYKGVVHGSYATVPIDGLAAGIYIVKCAEAGNTALRFVKR